MVTAEEEEMVEVVVGMLLLSSIDGPLGTWGFFAMIFEELYPRKRQTSEHTLEYRCVVSSKITIETAKQVISLK